MNKRLLFVGVSSMGNHAGQDKLYFLADELGRRDIPVTVMVPDLKENRDFFANKPYIQTRLYRPGSVLAELCRKASIAKEAAWSAIWLVGVGLRSYVVRGRSTHDAPIIKDFDEFPSMIESFGPFRRAYLRWIEHRMIQQAQGFTCASVFLEQSVRRQRPDIGNRLLRLRVAISAEEHRIDPELVSILRQASNGRPILLYVGTLSRMYETQLNEIIQLAVVLRRRASPARVRIAGTGPDMEYFKLRAAAARAGDSLEFAGHVRRQGDLAAHMESAQVLIFPFPANSFNLSRCPTKAFHYAAADKPVVTNKTGEVAMLFGDSALYYPDGDIEALADRCHDALANARGFHNGIPFATLTWEMRSRQFKDWLAAHHWLPESPRGWSQRHPLAAPPRCDRL